MKPIKSLRFGTITVYLGLANIAVVILAYLGIFGAMVFDWDPRSNFGQSIADVYGWLFIGIRTAKIDARLANKLITILMWGLGFIVGFVVDCSLQVTLITLRKLKSARTQ